MDANDHHGHAGEDEVSAFVGPLDYATRVMTDDELKQVTQVGAEFSRENPGIWLMISGRFDSSLDGYSTEDRVKDLLMCAFDGPKHDDRTIKVILDSVGGNLDSAYLTALYLAAYARTIEVYVPSSARSASTLLAVRADRLYLSDFGSLGPLDSQIWDPRNPVRLVSALDCYQSVDYVRDFGLRTLESALTRFLNATYQRVPVNELISPVVQFSLGVIEPMMKGVPALDFGGWGRSLRISERYATKLLEAKNEAANSNGDHAEADQADRKPARIAHDLVYGYPHHLFPIDLTEVRRLGLKAERMDEGFYEEAMRVVNACNRKNFVGFISRAESQQVAEKCPEILAKARDADLKMFSAFERHATEGVWAQASPGYGGGL